MCHKVQPPTEIDFEDLTLRPDPWSVGFDVDPLIFLSQRSDLLSSDHLTRIRIRIMIRCRT